LEISVLGPAPTCPADRGNRAWIRAVCRQLQARGARIQFLYFPRDGNKRFRADQYRTMVAEWDYFHVIAPAQPLRWAPEGRYRLIDDWWDDAISRFIE